MKKLIALFVALFALASLCYAQGSPETLRDQAYNKIKVSSELVEKAKKLLIPGQTKENLVIAAQLFVQAGQLFEQANNALKALGKNYVSQDDINNCDKAVQVCVDAITHIKRILGVQEIPPPSNSIKTLVTP